MYRFDFRISDPEHFLPPRDPDGVAAFCRPATRATQRPCQPWLFGAREAAGMHSDSDAACGAERDLPVRGQAWRRARSCRGGQPSGQARPGLPRRASASLLACFGGGPLADSWPGLAGTTAAQTPLPGCGLRADPARPRLVGRGL